MAFQAKARRFPPIERRGLLAKKWRQAGLGLLVMVASSAMAQLPAPLKAGHPRLFLTQSGIDALKKQLPYYPSALFPAVKGSMQFSLLAKHKDAQDAEDQSVFGAYSATNNTIYIRHVDGWDTPGTVGLQILFIPKHPLAAQKNVFWARLDLTADVFSDIKLSWDAQQHTISLQVNGIPVPALWGTAAAPYADWTANEQLFDLGVRRNEMMRNFVLRDGQGQELMRYASFDTDLKKAWSDYRSAADKRLADILSCATIAPTSSDYPKACKVATGHRATIYESAQWLSLAWLLTEQDKYRQGLLTYVDMLLASPLPAGNEWSMGGRVAAMGLVYDWLFDLMGSESVPAAMGGGSYRSALAQRIKDTIAAENTETAGDHLVASMCGSNQHLRDTSTVFDCAQKPVYEHWNRPAASPSIATYYVSGHAFSAVTNMALGLLAIAEEHPEVVPMIETAYAHFDKGFMAARAAISADGGHQMGFAYGVSSIPERLLLWRTALDNRDGTPLLQADWQDQLLYPYIYGLRSDGLFPASGDNYDLSVRNPLVGQLSRGVASVGGDGVAWSFYREQVDRRAYKNDEILERLFWPAQVAPVPIASLPLARHFRVSGQVVMRDTWDYANATLLDFKSSSFAAQNHQHADQNSFALYYKAPLLLDTGLYDTYESVHWWNYYTRSVAHNTITVYDTVDDQTELLMNGVSGLSRDGGQWMQALQQNYPTIDEIQPGGVNALDGIVRYENTPEYTYTSGNASKAYSATRLDRDHGFVRQVLFLRRPAFWPKPVTVVFDSVRSKRGLPATFLLHTAHDPAGNTASTSNLGDGRYKFGYSAGQRRIATVRNGGGMLIVQTVLPENAVVHKVGGLDHDGTQCRQMSAVTANLQMASSGDCRFMVRRRQADGSDLWFNHPPQKSEQKTTTEDVGTWRLEVTAATAPAVNAPEYFLHTLFVANNDDAAGTAQPPNSQRLVAAANTEALLLASQLHVLFNREVAPAARMDWTSPLAGGAILATGLKPGTHYALTLIPAGGAFARSLVETPEGTGTHLSSDQGVLSID